MPTINTEVEFDVYCDMCGNLLDVGIVVRKANTVKVKPCNYCMGEARLEGYANGMKDEAANWQGRPQ